MRRAAIIGWGDYTPPAVLSNMDLASVIDTSDEWIQTRSGIKERRISHVSNADMATAAAKQALAAADLSGDEMDLIIVATCSPDRAVPSVAAYVQRQLGGVGATMDLNAACSGFVYALSVANGMIAAGTVNRALIIGAERLSSFIDLQDRTTAVLFGDGAGAVVVEATEGPEGVLSSNLHSDGSLSEILTIRGAGTEGVFDPDVPHTVDMEGREVFRNAVTRMGEGAVVALENAGLDVEDIDVLISHQANIRIIDATARRLSIDPDTVYTNIHAYGNTSAASIPIALSEALDQGAIKPGDVVAMVAFGGGLTWGAAILRWGDRVTRHHRIEHDLPGTDKTGLELLAARVRGLDLA
ncbi:MAG: beta-ketoacyl-ACP synthase III [Acidimicrobiia bacterium]|nr:beta-ketoacyl-ACP synthase III [Acidimicrobiia bacterium]